MALILKVYSNGEGRIVLDDGRGEVVAPPNLVIPKYTRRDNLTIYDDRVSLYISGVSACNYLDRYPDLIRDENGGIIGGIDDVQDYFETLGLGEASGGSVDLSNYYTKEQVDAGFVPRAVYDIQIAFILDQLGIQQLDSPPLSADTPTQTSVNITIGQVANATSYELFRNGVSVYIGAFGVIPQTGLTPSTDYNFTSVASGNGYAPSDPSSIDVTTQASQQPQLPAGTLQAGTITPTSISVTGSTVANAELYRFIRNGQVVTTQANPSYTFTGLNPSTNYTLGRQAIANGYTDSATVQVNAMTEAAQPADNLPFSLPHTFAA